MARVLDWYIMPTLFPFLMLTNKYGEHFYLTHMDELMTVADNYIWRRSDKPDVPEIEHPQKRKRLSGVFVSPKSQGYGMWAFAYPLRSAGSMADRALPQLPLRMGLRLVPTQAPARMSVRPAGTRTGLGRATRCFH